MTSKPNTNREVIIPFGERFKETWELWKEYKLSLFKFRYKSEISEQAALKRIVKMSDGSEELAIDLIENAISRQWEGIYPIDKKNVISNGTTRTPTPANKQTVADNNRKTRSELNELYNNRFGSSR